MDAHESRAQEPQLAAVGKISEFHAYLENLVTSKCTTCYEAFPGLKLQRLTTECQRCWRDKHIPKLYSSDNNMNPGPVPQHLLVSNL